MRLCIRVCAISALLLLASSLDSTHATSTTTTGVSVVNANTSQTPSTSLTSSRSAKIPSSAELSTPASSSSSSTTATTSVPATAICQARTVNFITHTLPQQCLRSRTETSQSTGSTSTTAIETSTETTKQEHGTPVKSETTRPPSAPAQTVHLPQPEAETDTDSPLDNANFLSFEDWKKQNVEKAGQSLEHVGKGRGASSGAAVADRKRPLVDSLESLGEEGEIDFTFGGFGGGSLENAAGSAPPSADSRADDAAAAATRQQASDIGEASQMPTYMRSRDAGKTCKERYNYASFDCAATILKTNPQCKSSSSVLVENKDSYMLNECAAENKFLIVELCDDIIVDTVVLANFEFFSSMVRAFRVSVSDRYPPKPGQWVQVGVFEARNSREIQAFLVEGPRVWARYLRIEFLTHYGNEYYCPVSLVRVHGITMMEEYKHEEERARGEMDSEEQGIVEAVGGLETVVTAEAIVLQTKASPSSEEESKSTASTTDSSSLSLSSTTSKSDLSADTHSAPSERSAHDPSISSSGVTVNTSESSRSTTDNIAAAVDGANHSAAVNTSQNASVIDHGANSSARSEASTNATSTAVQLGVAQQMQNGTLQPNTNSSVPANSTGTNASPELHSSSTSNGTANSTASASPSAVEKPKSVASVAVQPAAPSPSTQESFFKSVDKRLKALESNASLSLQYIEEQSRILRDAFTKVEKRQLTKTETFLDHLNNTVMAELKSFRVQYDQLWQSTVIELETHREQYQREILAISSRLSLLADEVVFQKRMAVVQSTLLILCLAFVLFTKSGASNLDLPLMQSMMNRGPKAKMTVPFDSPPLSPHRRSSPDSGPQSLRKSGFARLFKRPGSRDGGSPASIRRPVVEVSTATPLDQSPEPKHTLKSDDSDDSLRAESEQHALLASTEEDDFSDATAEEDEEDANDEDDDDDSNSNTEDVKHVSPTPRHTRSGPATPQGTRDTPLAWEEEESTSSSLVNGEAQTFLAPDSVQAQSQS